MKLEKHWTVSLILLVIAISWCKVMFEMSQILNCGIDQRTLSILASLVENGVNPEALAAVVKELKRESDALKVSVQTFISNFWL